MNTSVATSISTGTPRRSFEDPADHVIESSEAVESAPGASGESGENYRIYSHARNPSGTVSATTTISQSYEPLSPRQPPALVKSLSRGEEYQRDPQKALSELGTPPHARGLLLLAEMSSEGNLATQDYTKACLQAARQNTDFVLGFICQRSLNSAEGDNFINMTPGVSLPPEGEGVGVFGDGKGQRWRDPREVICNDGADVIIVGRGVLKADDRKREAQRYQQKAWAAYEERLGRSDG